VEDEDTVLRIDTDPSTEAESVACGKFRPVGHDFVVRLGQGGSREQNCAGDFGGE
jgi:hypothetical protein